MDVHPSDLYRWRRELDEHGADAFSGLGRKRADDDRVAELERKVGQQTLEIDFLKRALLSIFCVLAQLPQQQSMLANIIRRATGYVWGVYMAQPAIDTR